MAPSIAELASQVNQASDKAEDLKSNGNKDNDSSYPFYLPFFGGNEKWPPIEIYEYVDPGLRADRAKPHLLTPEAKLEHISPYIGTEISGMQISQLSKEGLDELALYAAERKVLVCRDQDFKDIGPDRQIELAKHFGNLHRHSTSGNVQGFPEFSVIYRETKLDDLKHMIPNHRTNLTQWHADTSYERQPAGIMFIWILEQPSSGGDTLYASTVEAYKRFSPEFQQCLEGLRAVHSDCEQAEAAIRRGAPLRRQPIETEHPLVRKHPVTGEKALYVNPIFTRHISGFKTEESEHLLRFLYDHISKGSDFQIRVLYKPGTVVIWDNRVTVHSALADFDTAQKRHAVRLTSHAEVPIPARV